MYQTQRDEHRVGRGRARALAKRIVQWAAAAVLAVVMLGTGGARAQQAPPIKVKEALTVDRAGDGKFNLDVKMPVALYTALKIKTPNTALLLRQMGLSHDESYVVEGVDGTFDDGDSTVHIRWTTRSLARMGGDHLWEIPILDGDGLDVISVHDNEAIFSTASQTPLGLATMVVQATVPAGSGDLQVLRSPSRLAFRMPPAAGQGHKTALDFTLQVKPQVMSCLAKSYANRSFAKMWVARAVLKNTGDQSLADYRIRFRMPQYTGGWGPWQQCEEVVPGQTLVDAYFPVFDLERMGRVSSSRQATLEMQYEYRQADGKQVRESDNRTLQVLGRNEVFFSSMPAEDAVGFRDQFDFGPAILASFVTRDDPVIQQVAGWVSGQAGGVAASASDEGAVKFLQALYEFMAANKIAYQTPPEGQFNGQLGQHIKYGRDVLQNRAGTCVDLAILYGSVCEAVGLRPVLFLIPGHCFPGVYLPASGNVYAVETTMVGRADFQQAVKQGLAEATQARQTGPAYEVNIRQLRDAGVYGLELPPLPPSTLTDWGIHIVSAPKPTPPTPPAPAGQDANAPPRWLVGKWGCSYWLNDNHIEMYVNLDSSGRYTCNYRLTDSCGQSAGWVPESGTYQVGPGKIVLTVLSGPNKGITRTREYTTSNGELWVTFEEIGDRIRFSRVG
ncbi:MAG TPA: hypothetical protein VG013_36565 [Gemmataceae bacterium]|jgi:hypothetical protein|nr:hypothetical protein [Gemmataceae bacterium]